MHRNCARRRTAAWDDCGITSRAVASVLAADHVDIARKIVKLVPCAPVYLRVKPSTQVLTLDAATARLAEVERASMTLHVQRVLHQRDPVICQTLMLKGFEVPNDNVRVRRRVLLDVFAASFKELREHNRTANRARIWNVRVSVAVGSLLIAASLLDLVEVAVVGMLVAEEPTRSGRVKCLQADIVEVFHLFHAAHLSLREHLAALVP